MLNREKLEENQILIYIITIVISIFVALNWSTSHLLEKAIEPIIGILLYSMFSQIPFLDLKQVFKNRSFFKALLVGNFIFIPVLVWALILLFPNIPLITLGILLVLLTPCIDYVIVFSHMGKGNAKAVLASTPLLFIFQLIFLPLYLWLFLGKETLSIVELSPFINAFLYLILVPFLLSILTQAVSKSANKTGTTLLNFSAWLPVPFMALTFFVVIASQFGVIYEHPEPILRVVPIYLIFAILAPLIGLFSAKLFHVDVHNARAIAFSTSTRNSLVVLPLALALPSPANQLIAVVIVTQTIVEIFFELIYIKVIPILIK